jgi:diguanylate cyclase (GGDEF)-like protein
MSPPDGHATDGGPRGGSEKRQHTRHAIYLPARIAASGADIGCVVRDYCRGGMFVSWNDPIPAAASRLARGDAVTVRFGSGEDLREGERTVEATVARVLAAGVGIAFRSIDAVSLAALERAGREEARSAADTQTRRTDVDAPAIIERCKDILGRFLRPTLSAFFKRVDESLFLAARDADSPAAQRAYFDTMTLVQGRRDALSNMIHQTVVGGLDHLGEPRGPIEQANLEATASALSLVEKDEFEELLIIAGIVARAEPQYKEQLWQIERRLTQIAKGPVDRSNNPVGPSSICHGISAAMDPLGLPPEHLRTIYEVMQDSIIPPLARLYEEFDHYLHSCGLRAARPPPSEPKPVVKKKPRPPRSPRPIDERVEPVGPAAVEAAPVGAEGAAAQAPAPATPGASVAGPSGASAGSGAAGAPAVAPSSPAAAMTGAGVAVSAGGFAAGAPIGPPGAAVGQVQPAPPVEPGAGGARVAAGSSAGPAVSAVYAPGAPPSGTPIGGVYAPPVPSGAAVGAGVIGAPAAGGDAALPGMAPPSGVAVGGVYAPPVPSGAAMGAGVIGAPAAGGGAAAAGVPLGAPGIAPAGGIGVPVPFHAARALLGLRRQIGGDGAPPAGPPQATYSVNEVLGAMSMLEQEDQGPWGEETQDEDFRKRLLAVLGTGETGGEARALGDTESDVIDMVGGILESLSQDVRLPQEVKPYISRLRTPLHKLALLDDSFLTDAAHPARQALNRFAELRPSGDGQADDEALIRLVEQLVRRVNTDFDANPQIFSEILGQLDEAVSAQREEFEKNMKAVVKDCEQQQAVLRAQRKGKPDRGAQREVSKEWELWLNRAKRLRPGDALSLKRGAGHPLRVALAWIGEDFNPFVFVDAKGEKVATMTLQELAMQLRRGTAVVLERSELPAVDRALFQTLYRMHDEIGRQALQDTVTGLVNRKRFLGVVENAAIDVPREGAGHVVGLLRIDGVDALTERAGASATAALLKKVAAILIDSLGDKVVLARAGERDFGLLFERCDLDAARSKCDELVKLIEKIRVRYKEDRFPLKASAGLIAVRGEARGVEDLIRLAEAAAVAAGERGARVSVGDAAEGAGAAPLPSVDWHAWLDEVLEASNVTLRCQQVRAVTGEEGNDLYFEIVAGVEADSKLVLLPSEIMRAAELREGAIAFDRMLISETLQWMARHSDALAGMGGCAINLSVHSMADPALMDFVLGELTETMVPPGKLCFEIGQLAVVSNLSEVEKFVRTMKEFGCRFSIDDFGTTETAQGYLNNLPVDYLKIDGLFIREIDRDDKDYAVVKSIHEIGRLTGKKTIADQADTGAVMERLREIGIDYAQGAAIAGPCLLDDVA